MSEQVEQQFKHVKDWDSEINRLQEAIIKNQDNLDDYLNMNYLLMHILVEEDYDKNKHDYYVSLLKKFFDESYNKFNNNPEYLFFIAKIIAPAEWYIGLECEDVTFFFQRALELEPNNLLYQWGVAGLLDKRNIDNRNQIKTKAKRVLKDSFSMKALKSKGALGNYLLTILNGWSKE